MYYYDTLEEMSEGHKSAILQRNKSPSDDGHTYSYEYVYEQKGPTSILEYILYYIDGNGNKVILKEYVTKENEK